MPPFSLVNDTMSKRFIPRLYVPEAILTAGEIVLSPDQAHYVRNVMRLKVHDMVHVFNGTEGEWQAKVIETSKKSVQLDVIQKLHDQSDEQLPELSLVFAPVKQVESLLRQATELGVKAFMPIQTTFTTAFVKEERFKTIILNAAEQCERLSVPQLASLQNLPKLLEEWDESVTLIYCDETRVEENILQAAQLADLSQKYAILIGPEGGFSEEELQVLKSKPYVKPVSLGATILKADTAATAAIAAWMFALSARKGE